MNLLCDSKSSGWGFFVREIKVIMYYYYPNKNVNLPTVEYVANKQNLQEDPFTDSAVNEIVFKRVVDGKTITVTVTNN